MNAQDSLQYDLIIAGGGIAGSLAAVAAAREGISVLLVEEQGFLGGSLTACGTGPMMTFHAGSTQVIQGLPEELIMRLVTKGLSPGHIVDSTGYTYSVTPFDAEGMKRELELMVAEAGATLLFHTTIAAVEKGSDNGITAMELLSCGTRFMVRASYFVDATGDGDLIAMAGAPYTQGRAKDGKDQPMTMNFKLVDVDIDHIRALMDTEVSLFPFLAPKAGLHKQAQRLSCSGFQEIMRNGIASGEITFDRDIVLVFETNARNEVIVNMTRVNGENPVQPFSLSRAEQEGRRQVWELYAFLRRRVPGFSKARLTQSGPRIGIRSSRRLLGLYQLTVADVLNQTRFPDAISTCGYPIDVHSPDGAATDSVFLPDGASYTIPYRCLLNAVVPNLLAAGRNISCEFDAHASLRVSPSCGAIGQAAGAAVALAVRSGKELQHLDIDALRTLLCSQGAYL